MSVLLHLGHLFISSSTCDFSWFDDFESVEVVDQTVIDNYPYQGDLTVKTGNLIKFEGDPKVYAVEPNDLIRWIISESIFYTLGYDFSQVIELPLDNIDYYQIGSDIIYNTHPNGQLLKHGIHPGIFYMKDGAEYAITSEEQFRYYGLRWKDVFIIPVSFWYSREDTDYRFELVEW